MDKSGQTLALTLTYAFIPHKLLIINKWRYGDYLACRRALHSWLRPQSALSRRAVELKFSSPAHLITFRFAEFGGGMGIRTPDLLIANETLYQLSYTPNMLDFK